MNRMKILRIRIKLQKVLNRIRKLNKKKLLPIMLSK